MTFCDLSDFWWKRGTTAEMPATPPHTQAGYVDIQANKIYISGHDMQWHEITVTLTDILGDAEDGEILKRSGDGITGAVAGTDYAAADHDHDSDYASISHNHDSDYAPLNHDHDAYYAAINHDHDEDYAAINHNHDEDYAAASHGHDPSDITGFDDINVTYLLRKTTTSELGGINPNTYATAGHNHDGIYAFFSHNHDSAYASASHTHSINNITRAVEARVDLGSNVSISAGNSTDILTRSITPSRTYLIVGQVTVAPAAAGRLDVNVRLINGTAQDFPVASQQLSNRSTIAFALVVQANSGNTVAAVRCTANTADMTIRSTETSFSVIEI